MNLVIFIHIYSWGCFIFIYQCLIFALLFTEQVIKVFELHYLDSTWKDPQVVNHIPDLLKFSLRCLNFHEWDYLFKGGLKVPYWRILMGCWWSRSTFDVVVHASIWTKIHIHSSLFISLNLWDISEYSLSLSLRVPIVILSKYWVWLNHLTFLKIL